MTQYCTAIFDLDGTLYDTIDSSRHCFNLVCAYYHLPLMTLDEAFQMIGPSFNTIIRRIQPEATQGEIAELIARIKAYYLSDTHRDAPFQGLSDLLMQLSKAGVNLCVASMKEQELVERTLERTGTREWFLCVQGFSSETPDKRKAVEKCLQVVGERRQSVGHAVMIGDHMSDWDAARKNGIDFIAASYGYGMPERLAKELNGCIYCAKSMTDIGAYLLKKTGTNEEI